MLRRREAVLLRGFREPFVHLATLELGYSVAAGANKMVVVTLAAQPIARLPGAVGELVHHAALAQDGERSVDRRKPDRLAALP